MEQDMSGKTSVADDLIASLRQAVDYAEGRPVDMRISHVEVGPIDVRKIRRKLSLTQARMALALGVSLSGYRKWEQGQRQPHGAARTLLRVMDLEPEAVARVLRRAA